MERLISALQFDQDEKWHKTGSSSLLVTQISSTSTGLAAMAEGENIPLKTDHSGLVKYESMNQGCYPIVREKLRRLINEAKSEVANRFTKHRMFLYPGPQALADSVV